MDSLNSCNDGDTNWASKVRFILSQYGFANVWNNPDSVDPKLFLPVFKQRLMDCYFQQWRADLQNNNVLKHLYLHVKHSFCFSNYLKVLKTKHLRQQITRLIVSSHALRIESGRHGSNRVEREARVCQLCECGEIEDEYHFVIKCKAYDQLRQKHIKSYFYRRPSMQKFIELLNSESKAVIVNLAKYIFIANKKRVESLNRLQ